MSIERTDTVDAVAVRDGWAVLSIHAFGEWEDIENPGALLEAKLRTYFEHVESPRFQARLHRVPARIELVSRDPVPEPVRALCTRYGVTVLAD